MDGGALRSLGWGVRAEQAYGELSPDASWTLSTSEIGADAFCLQAWFLQRCRLPVTAEAEARRFYEAQRAGVSVNPPGPV